MNCITFSLKPLSPFQLELTAWALCRRPDNNVDRWDGKTYRRILILEERPVEVAVIQSGLPDEPQLRITVTGIQLTPKIKQDVAAALEQLLGIQTNLAKFYKLAAHDPRLKSLAQRFRGLKPPRFLTLFEALVNGIACQQVTLTLGIRLLNRLTENYGVIFKRQDVLAYAFPRPEDLAVVKPKRLRRLGFSHQKVRALIELSHAIVEKHLDLEELVNSDDEMVLARLQQLRGVGRWTAEYVLLRGLGRLHIFPGDDVGARNNLQRWLRLRKSLDYGMVRHTLAKWKPYGGLIYFHLLLNRLAELGYLS